MNPWRLSQTETESIDPQIEIGTDGIAYVTWIEITPEGNGLRTAWSYNIGNTWFNKDDTELIPSPYTINPDLYELDYTWI